jgi:hypothetical protein
MKIERHIMKNSLHWNLRLILGASLLLAAVHPLGAQVGTNWTGLRPYVTTNAASATNQPPAGGGGGWEVVPTNGVTVKAYSKIWFGFLNTEDSAKRKCFHIEIYTETVSDIACLSPMRADGFNGSGVGTQGSYAAGGFGRVAIAPGGRADNYVFIPQPAWEAITYQNICDHDVKLKSVQAWSVCTAASCPTLDTLAASNTLFGSVGPGVMLTNQHIREVYVFPETIPVNPGVQPQFVAPPVTGPWNFQFLQVDPYGGTHPLGVKWFTSGTGLAPDQEVDFSLAMQGPRADEAYTMYAFDGTTGQYQVYELNLVPELNITGDINGMALQFDSVAGMNHALETSADLSNWQPFQTNLGTGQLVTIPCTATNPAQFFRFQLP